jgi:hypothetical protein
VLFSNACGCDSEFTGCAAQAPLMNVRADRSGLPGARRRIIDDPTDLLAVLTKLARRPVRSDTFAQSLLSQVRGLAVSSSPP